MTGWDVADLAGPDGEDWRVPVSELAARQVELGRLLSEAGVAGAMLQHPVDLYYYAGGRQNASMFIPAQGAGGSIEAGGNGPVLFVRRSLQRALFEGGDSDCPHEVLVFPRMKEFSEVLNKRGVISAPGLQFGEVPKTYSDRFVNALSPLGDCPDITGIVHAQREVKSSWEQEQMNAAADVQLRMFEAVQAVGGEGITELELVAAAEAVSRSEGFGGHIHMRRFPLQCDRGVIVAGRAGGIPSFFDSAVGGTGAHPLNGMGSGFTRIKANEPVLVDLVHAHRGYIVDMTRMFVAGSLDAAWVARLEDMVAVKDTVVDVLDRGGLCSEAWEEGFALADELGHASHLMGMAPDQSRFLGHSVGLQLDESPVVAKGFERPLPIGATMAIEPKVVHAEGSIGTEDTWIRDEDGMRPITADGLWPAITEW
ncbi:M24 family metallopeptidase [Candidatus Poseidoniales archaeon]|jgi:Xaa-Pro aminopeptidase|nr:M24 family metallopeptidase [Candidatus Poseidoniales archaeon]MDB0005097.1 M24 family metallopeptidase [Candidatus Poseidoniaceae archaeon]MDA8557175.1 M24 family metallopeptidase [Candidatus Poseidoniales archaeon]MDA8724761.1 M24 family metallopeptidase [Candidatus Poseidoniales archaeon]MDA8801886.1 M24 family metallopeptidase [Candidatus Poseidoniales archaeon]